MTIRFLMVAGRPYGRVHAVPPPEDTKRTAEALCGLWPLGWNEEKAHEGTTCGNCARELKKLRASEMKERCDG